MPPRRTASGDARAARAQLRTADQSARVGQDTRAVEDDGGEVTVPLRDREFRLADEVGVMPLMEWAATAGNKTAGIAGLRAIFFVLEDVVHPDDWEEFKQYAREEKIPSDVLFSFVNAALEAVAGRPTGDASGS